MNKNSKIQTRNEADIIYIYIYMTLISKTAAGSAGVVAFKTSSIKKEKTIEKNRVQSIISWYFISKA